MITLYSHYVENREIWQSCHDRESWWPAKVADPWSTDIFVRELKSWADSSRFFKIVDPTQLRHVRGQYLIVHTNEHGMQDCQGLACCPMDALSLVNKGDLDLLLVYVHETFTETSFSDWHDRFVQRLKIMGLTRPNSIKVLLGTKIECPVQNNDLSVKYIWYPWHAGWIQNQIIKNGFIARSEEIANPGRKIKKFVSLGGKPLPHRLRLLQYLHFLGIADQGISTSHLPLPEASSFQNHTQADSDFTNWLATAAPISCLDAKNLQWGVKTKLIGVKHLCDQAGWEIVQETYHDIGQATFLTEKLFRSMMMTMPFVVNGPKHSLRVLRDLGYQTFGDIVDESYDDIDDPTSRIFAVAHQIKKICDWTAQDHDNHWPRLLQILQHNRDLAFQQKHLQNIHQLLI